MSWGNPISKAWQSATQTARNAYQSATGAASNAYKEAVAAKNRAVDAAAAAAERAQHAASSAVDSGKKTSAAAVKKAQDAAQATFGPRIVGQPIQKCPCDPAEKKARAAERKALIGSARSRASSLPPAQKQHVLATASRFEADNKAVDRARISRDVYDKQPPPPPSKADPCSNISPPVGWTKVSDKDLANYGLTPADMKPAGSGFRAGLYKNDDDGTLVLAFKGTENKEDWANNFKQGLGLHSDYYDKAGQLSRKLESEVGPNFEVTGHSLGGGLASAAALAGGVPGTTFNAAGLNDKTVAKYLDPTAAKPPPVQAYQVLGDVLTGAQQSAPDLAAGTAGAAAGTGGLGGAALVPLAYGFSQVREAYGTHHKLPAVTDTGASYPTGVVSPLTPLQRHYMDTVINGLEKQKADDQAALKAA